MKIILGEVGGKYWEIVAAWQVSGMSCGVFKDYCEITLRLKKKRNKRTLALERLARDDPCSGLAEDPSSVCTTHVRQFTACNSCSRGFATL